MFEQYESQIRAEAQITYPLEGVWLITNERCEQVENIHEEPAERFRVSKGDLARAYAKGLLAVVHSHPDRENVPSEADMQGQINTGVPWGILTSTADGTTTVRWWGGPERPPLIGRPFVHGITDCYALIRDYYWMEKDIDLPEFPRNWMWWDDGQDLFMEGFPQAGFRKIPPEEARPGDVWLAKIRCETINHGGILLDEGLMLHQIGSPLSPIDTSRLSAREPFSRYQRFVEVWLRYDP